MLHITLYSASWCRLAGGLRTLPAEISAKLPGTLGDIRLNIIPEPVHGSTSVTKPKLELGLHLLPPMPSGWEWVSTPAGDGWRDDGDAGGANAAGRLCI